MSLPSWCEIAIRRRTRTSFLLSAFFSRLFSSTTRAKSRPITSALSRAASNSLLASCKNHFSHSNVFQSKTATHRLHQFQLLLQRRQLCLRINFRLLRRWPASPHLILIGWRHNFEHITLDNGRRGCLSLVACTTRAAWRRAWFLPYWLFVVWYDDYFIVYWVQHIWDRRFLGTRWRISAWCTSEHWALSGVVVQRDKKLNCSATAGSQIRSVIIRNSEFHFRYLQKTKISSSCFPLYYYSKHLELGGARWHG